jgi:predicted NAD/FAD-dependent oxidoreductase
MPVSDPTILIVGAGVAGLSCARELNARGISNVVFERARGVGGRCATRRIHGQPVDHGLPFLHAKSGEFGEALNELDPAGKVLGWPTEVREPRLLFHPDALKPGRRRMARRAGVGEFAKWLGHTVDVRLGHEATDLADRGDRVEVRFGDGSHADASFVVLACHVRESVRLAEPLVSGWANAQSRLASLHTIEPIPTLTVIAGYDPAAFEAPFHLWNPLETTMLHVIVHDSSKREHPAERVLVMHARPGYSRERLADRPEEWQAELLWELGEILDPRAESPRWVQTHVWHDARIPDAQRLSDAVVFESGRGGSVALIGDAFAVDAGLEGAYFSGISFAEQIAMVLAVRSGRL